MPFAQHRDIFYLSGVDQEESILLFQMLLTAPKNLFLKTNEHTSLGGEN
jgi:Xaa-Pro aminopeptidase